jgi:hypothetical protein
MNQSEETKMALVQKDIFLIKENLLEINNKLDDKYVTKEEFKPIKMLVYGCVGLMLTIMVTSMVYLVVNQSGNQTASTIINK